jgi:hypothetical protein
LLGNQWCRQDGQHARGKRKWPDSRSHGQPADLCRASEVLQMNSEYSSPNTHCERNLKPWEAGSCGNGCSWLNFLFDSRMCVHKSQKYQNLCGDKLTSCSCPLPAKLGTISNRCHCWRLGGLFAFPWVCCFYFVF